MNCMHNMKTWFPPNTLKYNLLMLLLVWNAGVGLLSSPHKNVMTPSGPVRGTEDKFGGRTVYQYLGIPFAKPPVGELRFKLPQPVEPWTETLLANKMPPACCQYVEYPFPWYDFDGGKSEDCLHLNIWTPKRNLDDSAAKKYPVLVWIYGGGFTIGSSRVRIYNGKALAVLGEVIVVTTNYRMSAFGFLNSGTPDAPGNMGLYDIVEAIKWVNRNILAFGGDPRQVTLAGESASAIAIGLLCVSPLTKGLFHRVIMESGSPAFLGAESNTVNIVKTERLAKKLGCANERISIHNHPKIVVNCLRSVDALELAKAENSFHPTATRSYFPNYGDAILPRNPRTELINGHFHSLDVLIGNNHDEGVYEITSDDPHRFGYFGEKDPKINMSYGKFLIKETLGDLSNRIDEVAGYYFRDLREDQYDQIREKVYQASGDFNVLCPTVYFAESYSKYGNNVYYYFFVHRPSNTPWAKWTGVDHFEEVQFVFGVPIQEPKNYTKKEATLSIKMMSIWTNFVKYGNPGRIQWPLYSRENPIYATLDTNIKQKYGRGPHKCNCDFYRGYFGFV